jgi:hypothetical protein
MGKKCGQKRRRNVAVETAGLAGFLLLWLGD